MNSIDQNNKRKALQDVTSITVVAVIYDEHDEKRWPKFDPNHWFSKQPNPRLEPDKHIPDTLVTQNLHPTLALYNLRSQIETLSHKDMCTILSPDNELHLLYLLLSSFNLWYVLEMLSQC